MGCAPSLNSKSKDCVYSRNSNEFCAPEGQDEQVEESDVVANDKGCGGKRNNGCPPEANGNGGLAYLDASSADDVYKRLQQMKADAIEPVGNGLFLPVESSPKVLLVFEEEDEMTEAVKCAMCAIKFAFTLSACEKSALQCFSKQHHHLVFIDHRHHSTIDSLSLCRSIRSSSGGEHTTILAVINKSCVEEQEEMIIPLLSAGFSRIFIETCSVKSCLVELIQLEHNLMKFVSKMDSSDALFSALESSKEAIQITNSNNQIQYVNKAYEKLSGYKRAELIGSNMQQIFGLDSSKFEWSSLASPTESNGKNWEGCTEVKTKSGDVIAVDYRLISSYESRNPLHIIYVKDSRSCANKSSNTDAPFDVQNYIRGSVKSIKRSSEVRSAGSESGVPMFIRRQSVAKLHAMTIEAPITKVIKIITAVSENSPPEISDSLESVLDILRSTELYNPQHLTNQSLNSSEDQTTTDLVGGLMLQDAKKPTQTIYRRQSQENSSMKGQSQSGGLQLITDFESAPTMLKSILETESQWDFNVIELERLTSKRPLVWLGMTIFGKFQVSERLQCDERTIHKWLTLMEMNYHSKNSYHNSTHAADVLHATAFFLRHPRIKMMLDPMDEVACLIAAIVHDVDHPGKTSAFLSNSNNELAILYNDLSVLESHHSAHAFRLTTTNDKVNIFQNLDRETYRSLRKSIVDMVLATEIAKHFEHLTNFVKKFLEPALDIPEAAPDEIADVQEPEPFMESLITPENVVLVKRILIKCADVNNPLRPLNLCREWATRIAEEYFAQTDEEKKLNLPVVMPAFDRTTCNIASSQIVFIDIFINDMFTSWNAFLDMPHLMENLKSNYSYWKEQEKTSTSPTPKPHQQYSQPPQLSDVEEINLEKE